LLKSFCSQNHEYLYYKHYFAFNHDLFFEKKYSHLELLVENMPAWIYSLETPQVDVFQKIYGTIIAPHSLL